MVPKTPPSNTKPSYRCPFFYLFVGLIFISRTLVPNSARFRGASSPGFVNEEIGVSVLVLDRQWTGAHTRVSWSNH